MKKNKKKLYWCKHCRGLQPRKRARELNKIIPGVYVCINCNHKISSK